MFSCGDLSKDAKSVPFFNLFSNYLSNFEFNLILDFLKFLKDEILKNFEKLNFKNYFTVDIFQNIILKSNFFKNSNL